MFEIDPVIPERGVAKIGAEERRKRGEPWRCDRRVTEGGRRKEGKDGSLLPGHLNLERADGKKIATPLRKN